MYKLFHNFDFQLPLFTSVSIASRRQDSKRFETFKLIRINYKLLLL